MRLLLLWFLLCLWLLFRLLLLLVPLLLLCLSFFRGSLTCTDDCNDDIRFVLAFVTSPLIFVVVAAVILRPAVVKALVVVNTTDRSNSNGAILLGRDMVVRILGWLLLLMVFVDTNMDLWLL